MAPEDEEVATEPCPNCEQPMPAGHELCNTCSLKQYEDEPAQKGVILEGET